MKMNISEKANEHIEQIKRNLPGSMERDKNVMDFINKLQTSMIGINIRIEKAVQLHAYFSKKWNELTDPDNPHYEAINDYSQRLVDQLKNDKVNVKEKSKDHTLKW